MFFLAPTGTISLWRGDQHSTLAMPQDPQKREALFRQLIQEDGLTGESLEAAVQEMLAKAAALPNPAQA